jgi:glycosyltransferase involved in cell wall biosynthesis
MKFSICVPQYNRIQFLLQSLERISHQTWDDVEICISDDCSTDNTEAAILELQKTYRYPIVFSRNEKNAGYDRNYRKSVEISSGDYCLLIGNDDTLHDDKVIEVLVKFLEANNLPDIGFCNYVEHNNPSLVIERAHQTAVLGSGNEVALKNYSNFSFVGGVIYKRESFLKFNTSKYDGSVFAQMYLGVLMIARGLRLFSIKEPMVIKDLRIEGKMSNNYRDTLARSWKDFKVVNAGLPTIMHVLINGFKDAGTLDQTAIYRIFKKIYSITYPFWLLDYRSNKAFPEAVGLVRGLNPYLNEDFKLLNRYNRSRIFAMYSFSSVGGLVTPVSIFKKVKTRVYNFLKR